MEKLKRVVFYIRVSHQEQALHGFSLQAQLQTLTEYAERNNLKVMGIYTDEGVSGRKPIKQRPELQKMLNDAKKEMFDLILFIKLDRYFRSVAEYHECQKILNDHNIEWNATEEKYDITTANGRAFVNMKLTIAELEADQTGERIDLVNSYKVSKGQALSGSVPFGFMIERKDGASYVVKNPKEAPIVLDMIDYYLKHQSLRATNLYINSKYEMNYLLDSMKRLFKNTLLYGFYRGNPNYCEPYINKETFDKMQEIRSKNIKVNKTNNIFLFSGLVKCNCCGYSLSGFCQKYKSKNFYYYRCNNKYNQRKCTGFTVKEARLEGYLINNIKTLFDEYIQQLELKTKQNKNLVAKTDITKIKKEMERLNKMFQKNRIDEATYDREYELLEDKLKTINISPLKNKRNLKALQELLHSNFTETYLKLDRERKRAFWRSIIKEIRPENDDKYNIIFL